MWVSANQKISLSVLARNPHKVLAHEISHETGRGRGNEGPRAEEDGQSREGDQSRVVDRTDQSTEENRAVSRREQQLGLWTQAAFANMRR